MESNTKYEGVQIRQANYEAVIPIEFAGQRLDKVLALMLPDYSRTTIQTWLKQELVLLNNKRPLQRLLVTGGETIRIAIPEPTSYEWTAEDIPINVVYEDDDILVVNKPAGMVVHPGAGNSSETLLNALIHHAPTLNSLPRAGIVHRLDKNTSGLLVVAKTELARRKLIRQFKKRTASRQYLAVTEGRLISGGTIDVPIGRHPRDRTRMVTGRGKNAVSHFRIVSRFQLHTLVRVFLETGRTHQIRVHFRHAGFALVGDPDYGGSPKIPTSADQDLVAVLRSFRRQALHAEQLKIVHPGSNEECHWHCGVPADMRELIIALKKNADSMKSFPAFNTRGSFSSK